MARILVGNLVDSVARERESKQMSAAVNRNGYGNSYFKLHLELPIWRKVTTRQEDILVPSLVDILQIHSAKVKAKETVDPLVSQDDLHIAWKRTNQPII